MRVFRRSIALLLGAVPAVLGLELAVRLTRPDPVGEAARELALFQGDQSRTERLYMLDEELGYRPILGTKLFDERGFVRNDYRIEKAQGRQRILFIGDSVTRRGKIVEALRSAYGDGEYEFWNGGVTGFNTAQEVTYHERYTSACEPDHVILTFHLNDLERTPISFRGADGRMHVFMPHKNLSEVNAWLFSRSYLYRFYVGLTRTRNLDESQADVRRSLERLVAITEGQDVRLTVLVLPNLEPREDWNDYWVLSYEWITATLADLGVRHFSLLPGLERALRDGIDPTRTPGDTEHPSDAVAAYFAGDLAEWGLLERRETGFARNEPTDNQLSAPE